MKLNPYIILFVIFFYSILTSAFAQTGTYILNGATIRNTCNCYTLTQDSELLNGSLWNASKINLDVSFDYVFNVNLGCNDSSGADGLAFILQPFGTSIGGNGQEMGFAGISPSVGIILDTYQNESGNDPAYDHISIQLNGQITHGADLAGPVRASGTSDNIEDCKWHLFRIVWNSQVHKISAYFDNILRVEANIDLVNGVFNNDPFVYWGFSAATGTSANVQQVCTILNPDFATGFKNNMSCFGEQTSFINQSQLSSPANKYYWDLGDGTTCTSATPPPHSYSEAGIYNTKLVITGFDGCISDTAYRQVVIGDMPVSSFDIFDTCAETVPRISDKSAVKVGNINKWQWKLDGNLVSASQSPILSGLSTGSHQLQLSVESSVGCASAQVGRSFIIKQIPVVDIQTGDNCINVPVTFKGIQKDNLNNIKTWTWQFGDGQTGYSKETTHLFISPGIKNIRLTSTDDNGCTSLPATKNILINQVSVFAGNDTIVLEESYFQLNGKVSQTGKGPLEIIWSPSAGLEQSTSAITRGLTSGDKVFTLTATTSEGCIAKDDMKVMIFKGSAAYVPSAFTPNNDGKNERLKPYLIAIKQVYYFSVYNRWGQLVYTTTTQGEGWDGTIKGAPQPVGTYIWMLKTVDIVGNIYEKKGTSTLIR